MNERHGRLELVQILGKLTADNHIVGLWRCDCGTVKEMGMSRVRNGYSKSCGCLAREASSKAAIKHGMRGTPEYSSWRAMKERCLNANSKDYYRYGGAGIGVCDEWARSFEAFYEHVGPRTTGTTLDRIDWRKGYEPGNVRWATPVEQSRNRKDIVFVDTDNGRVALVDYAKSIGLTKGAAHLRLKRGKLEGIVK